MRKNKEKNKKMKIQKLYTLITYPGNVIIFVRPQKIENKNKHTLNSFQFGRRLSVEQNQLKTG